MTDLSDLINFIKSSGIDKNGQKWSIDQWGTELRTSIPNLEKILKNSNNWEHIEIVRPKGGDYLDICIHLVKAGGLGLAKKWFYSENDSQKYAAKRWLDDHISMWPNFDNEIKNWIANEYFDVNNLLNNFTPLIWKDTSDDVKISIITQVFDRNPGEPFETMKRYRQTIKHFFHDFDWKRHRPKYHAFFDKFIVPNLPHVSGYIPSPQVEKLRCIVSDAKDKKYIQRIKEMISQREKACQNISYPDVGTQKNISYRPNRNEKELIARLLEKPIQSGYLPAALPPIYISSETPPIFVAYPELEDDLEENTEFHNHRDENAERENVERKIPRNRERRRPETISIEELLGVYQPRQQQITIYERGIKWRKHRFDEEWLFAVVLVHEIAHWISHQLHQPGNPCWPTELYILGEMDVHEGLAQLMTYWVAKEVGGEFKRTFDELNMGQSSPYHVFKQFKQFPIQNVIASLERLRQLSWPARLQDWKRALK